MDNDTDLGKFMISQATSFNHPRVIDWWLDGLEVAPDMATPATIGSGPFDEEEFDDFLRRNDIEPQELLPHTNVLIIGRDDWSATMLDGFLQVWEGEELRVYSQEMYLIYWAKGFDPYEAPREVLDAFIKGHPALEYFDKALDRINTDWRWPTTVVPEKSSGDLKDNWHEEGLLKHMGYRVGSKGRPRVERREILRNVFFHRDLPFVNSGEYMAEWGPPESTERLMKLANSIAAFCRNGKRKSKPPRFAIADWEEDLAWLRREFYGGGFEWPGTEE